MIFSSIQIPENQGFTLVIGTKYASGNTKSIKNNTLNESKSRIDHHTFHWKKLILKGTPFNQICSSHSFSIFLLRIKSKGDLAETTISVSNPSWLINSPIRHFRIDNLDYVTCHLF